ncbi:MAG TPA: hypothetical protein VGK20_11075 [Candidatus Binatia bacterium]|jgi:hypothetical protein
MKRKPAGTQDRDLPRMRFGRQLPFVLRRHHSFLLWIALLLCAPLPFFLLEVGHQPLIATAQLLVVTLALIASEGASGALTVTAWILALQILLGAIAFGMLSIVVTRALDRALGARAVPATMVLIVVMFAVALTQPIYRTPFRTTGLQSTLPEAFE